ncbi:hypothetical protein D9613_007477 [Agrocybe pediades]|uniref:Uncharacterized protein n=1 Tax=Agrocybe pediades TaxID=84607 RepID=A0A8H4QN91_9AGAR|nr:hypothetical protein D9613_007477 [Agrocybe pediades]
MLQIPVSDVALEVKSCEGRVGAIVLRGEFFVTTPNMDHVFDPSTLSRMTYKTNYRLGSDDPLQWPQFFLRENPHYPCIPRKPEDLTPESWNYIMFHETEESDFEETKDALVSGFGFLRPTLLAKVRRCLDETIDPLYAKVKKMELRYEVFPILHSSIHRSFMHLEFLPLTRRQVLFVFADLQRDLLEFHAAYTYATKVMPQMKGQGYPASTVDHYVGGFFNDISLSDAFVRAGVPVWIVHPASRAGAIRVDKLVDPLSPHDFFPMNSASATYPFSFEGTSPLDPRKYNVLGRYRREFLSYGHDAFDTASLEPEDLLVKTAKKARHQPYKIPNHIPRGDHGRNKFLDITHPLLPPMHRSWSTALLLVNQTKAFSTQLGYAFPEPGLFVSFPDDSRRALFFYNWVKYRPILIHRMMTFPCPIRGQVWRTLLNLPADIDLSSEVTSLASAADAGTITKAGRERKMVMDMLEALLDHDKTLSLNKDASKTPDWFGNAVSPDKIPPDSVCRQILWEISELNFRYEMYVLDAHRHAANKEDISPIARDILVSRCFYGQSTLFVHAIKDSGQGLSSNDWVARRPYIFALRDVIQGWDGWKYTPDVDYSSETSVLGLENVLLRFYAQKFYDTFGRAPSVPRCIDDKS